MYLLDTHAHIYLPEFDADLDLVMERALIAGVHQVLMPAIDSTTHESMLQVEKKHPECIAMIGLHPCSVKSNFSKELQIIENYLQNRKFIAIGETGLDFYWDRSFTEAQYEAFHYQIKLALKYDLPIAIHSRNAIDECIEVVQQYPGLKGVFHCFSGNYEQAVKIMKTGFMLGIGGVVSFKNSGLDMVIEKTGLSKVILETDAPYLAPVPYRGKRNEPAYLSLIASKLAAICTCSMKEVATITTENAKNLFKL